jgi:hypothetical protein
MMNRSNRIKNKSFSLKNSYERKFKNTLTKLPLNKQKNQNKVNKLKRKRAKINKRKLKKL